MSKENIRDVMAKREERRLKPTAIASRLLDFLGPVEAPGTRYGREIDNLAEAIGRCQSKGSPFLVDTIVCPLYHFSQLEGDSGVVDGLLDSLGSAPRYRDKFVRFLITLSRVSQFIRPLGYELRTRVIFADAAVDRTDKLKKQFQVEDQATLRRILQENRLAYIQFHQEVRPMLENVKFEFPLIGEQVPILRDQPLDLYDLALAYEVVILLRHGAVFYERKLKELGVNDKLIITAEHAACRLATAWIKEGLGPDGSEYSVVQRAFLEIGGELVAYGLAGQSLVDEQNGHTSLFVSTDTPGIHRNDFYYAFLGRKGNQLALFSPAMMEAMPPELVTLFKNDKDD